MNDIQPITLPGIDPRRPLVIAGPCSAETEEQVLDTARSLAAEGIRLLRFIAERGKFGAFAYYCWAVGVLTLVLNVIK